MPRTDIEFKTYDHVTLRGWFYTPSSTLESSASKLSISEPSTRSTSTSAAKLPCIILSHGYTCLKEMSLDTIASTLVSALPLCCIVYDNRGFGTSDTAPNMPRSEIIASVQVSDLKDAITYACTRDEVDTERIGVWGYSFSGGNVLEVAATDRRVGTVVALAPFADGKIVQRNVRPDMIKGLEEVLYQDRIDRMQGKEPGTLPVCVKTPLELAALPQTEAWNYFTTKATEGWKNELTIRSLEETASCFPSSRIHDISPTPLLMIVPTADVLTVTDIMLEAYSRAREPKELCLVKGGHFGVFEGEVFDKWMGVLVRFLRGSLCS